MGSCNKTCGLSNLHIKAGDPVYVFVLEQQQYHDRCYTTAFWKPILLPFQSTYNDYGAGENSHGVGLQQTIDSIRDILVELELGENIYHDIAVNKSQFDVDLLFEAVQEDRLSISYGCGSQPVKLDFVMIRKDIVDDILYNWQREKYVGNGIGNCGGDNNYINYKFCDVVNDIPKIIQQVKAYMDCSYDDLPQTQKHLPPEKVKMIREILLSNLNIVMRDAPLNLAWNSLRSIADSNMSRIVDIQQFIIDLIAQDKIDLATCVIKDCLIGCFIDIFMDNTRRHWTPTSNNGSQSTMQSGYLLLNDAISKVLQIEREEHDE